MNYLSKVRRLSTFIDKKEIEFYSKLDKSWMNEIGEFKGLHSLNKLRIPAILDSINSSNLKNKKILEVGCGGGILTFPLVRLGAFVTAIDPCKESIIAANNFANNILKQNYRHRVGFQCTTVQEFSKNNKNIYDIVIASEVLEHVPNVSNFMNKCASLTKCNGILFISATNKTFLSNLLAVKFAENVAGLLPPGSHNWDKFIKPGYLIKILLENNFSVKSYRGLTYNLLTNNWLWINNTDVNYFLIGKKNHIKV
uniref:Methyltransf_11 domain-containing protein n=1 Tax=Strongyloides venezuelensis TaxID=75913 RepID=A0A0K0FAQ0_STRVS